MKITNRLASIQPTNLQAGIAVFFACIILYLFTLCPTVYVGDSGEYTSSAFLLGVSHPPGYPIYSILGKVFTLIPLGSIASRVNFMSAFFGALTVLILYLIVYRLTRSTLPAVLSALLLGFSKTFWSQSVIAEVYALNVFFTALILLLLLLWQDTLDTRYLWLFAFIYGLSLTNHFIMMLFAPAYLYFILSTLKSEGKAKRISMMVCGIPGMLLLFLMGLAVYLYLPIRSSANPPLDWGNPETLKGFLNHVSRVQYKEFEFGKVYGLKNQVQFVLHFAREFSGQFTVFFFWLPLAGIRFMLKRGQTRLFLTTAIMFLANTLGLIFLLNFQYTALGRAIFAVYYLPAYLVAALWSGYALKEYIHKLRSVKWRNAIGGLMLFVLLVFNFTGNNKRNYYLAHDYGMNIMNTLEKGAGYFTFGDNQIFILAYLRFVEKLRGDVRIFNNNGIVFPHPYTENHLQMDKSRRAALVKEINRELIEKSDIPLYYSIRAATEQLDSGYEPRGLLARALKKNEDYKPDGDCWSTYRLRGIPENNRTDEYWTRDIGGEYYFFMGSHYIKEGNKERAVETFQKASEIAYDIDWVHNNLSSAYHGKLSMLDEAEREARLAIKLNPLFASPHNELGIVYYKKGRIQAALDEFKKALELDPGLPEALYNYNALSKKPFNVKHN